MLVEDKLKEAINVKLLRRRIIAWRHLGIDIREGELARLPVLRPCSW